MGFAVIVLPVWGEMMEDQRPHATFDVSKLDVEIVPARLYDFDLDMAMADAPVRIREKDLIRPSRFGYIDMSTVPEIRITIKEIKREYGNNQRDTLASLGKLSFSLFQHEFSGNLKELRGNRTRGFFGGKFKETVKLYGRCAHFFENEVGGRKRMVLYGDRCDLTSPIEDSAEYFNLSTSDMAQIILCFGILTWHKLPADAKEYFEGIVFAFKEYSKDFLVDTGKME